MTIEFQLILLYGLILGLVSQGLKWAGNRALRKAKGNESWSLHQEANFYFGIRKVVRVLIFFLFLTGVIRTI